jgi:hypothetical protein
MLGLELFDNGALAISADENGRIVARGRSEAGTVAPRLLPSRRSGPILGARRGGSQSGIAGLCRRDAGAERALSRIVW